MQNNLDPTIVTELNGLKYSVRPSGDGYELLDFDGEVIAWTLDRKWALRILLALELQSSMESE